ncbi:MAG: hypothetical protein ABEH83_08130 [Halobacterium sp.]
MSLLDDAARTAGRVSPYAAVPFALSLLAVDNVVQTASTSGLELSVKFALPTAVPTLWTVFDPPSSGVSFVTPTSLSLLPVYLLVDAVLTAGYLGGIYDAAHDAVPDFGDNAATYAVPVLVVRVVEFLLVGALALLAVDGGASAAIILVPFVFVVGYLIWGAPFLVVARDADPVEAIAWSASLATSDSQYVTFSVAFAVATAVASLFVSPLLAEGGYVVVFVLAALAAYPALVASAAAMHVIDGAAAPSRGA